MGQVFGIALMLIFALAVLFGFGALVYVIVKRIEDRKKENFEKRDH
ncbi:MAG: hypothetical protein R3277_11320 [Brumimicrobium sp.]|nr:hypothetical protein [Brumimicrobium sp.]